MRVSLARRAAQPFTITNLGGPSFARFFSRRVGDHNCWYDGILTLLLIRSPATMQFAHDS